jgi:hypothetical protein
MTRENIEIVKQIKLTSSQMFTLVAMSNGGGRERHIDYRVKGDLVALGLIEERDMYTALEKIVIEAEIREGWKQARLLTKARDTEGLDRIVDKIRGKQRDLTTKAYWLTKAAEEYLVKGKVTIVR